MGHGTQNESQYDMRMDFDRKTAARFESKRIESLLWALGVLAAGAWAFSIGEKLFLKLQTHPTTVSTESFLFRNSGQTALLFAVALIAFVALAAVVQALRGRALPPRAASVVLVTAMALRAIQIASQGAAQIADAQTLAGLMLLASVMYWGATRLWWLVLMPLASVAMFSPLVWFEFFKGASHTILIQVLTAPALAFGLSSILIVTRELRARAQSSFIEMDRLHARGLMLKKQMHGMESDLKSLLSAISRPAVLLEVPTGPLRTTDFSAEAALFTTASSYEDIDRVAREVLDEARAKVEGKKIRLLLTAPMGSSLPLSVRAESSAVARWIRAVIANSLDSVGGFPDAVVRITLRPGLTSLMISIEDNGRGFNDDLLTKLGASQEGRMSLLELRHEIESVGGRFDVQARLGVGSRLSIELPRLEQVEKRDPRSMQAFKGIQEPSGSHPPSSSSPHV